MVNFILKLLMNKRFIVWIHSDTLTKGGYRVAMSKIPPPPQLSDFEVVALLNNSEFRTLTPLFLTTEARVFSLNKKQFNL
jgi:hypothetical protein